MGAFSEEKMIAKIWVSYGQEQNFMGAYFFLYQAKFWIIIYLRGEFQTSTSISVHMEPISELASTFTPSILCIYLFSFSS